MTRLRALGRRTAGFLSCREQGRRSAHRHGGRPVLHALSAPGRSGCHSWPVPTPRPSLRSGAPSPRAPLRHRSTTVISLGLVIVIGAVDRVENRHRCRSGTMIRVWTGRGGRGSRGAPDGDGRSSSTSPSPGWERSPTGEPMLRTPCAQWVHSDGFCRRATPCTGFSTPVDAWGRRFARPVHRTVDPNVDNMISPGAG